MLTNYTQPEHPQPTDLESKVRGARIECERLELQIAATIARALSITERMLVVE